MITKFNEFINEETKLFGKNTVWDEDKQKSVDPHKWSWDKKRKEQYCDKCGSVRIKHGYPHNFYYDYITPTGEDSTNIPFCVSKEKQFNPIRGDLSSKPITIKTTLPEDIKELQFFRKCISSDLKKWWGLSPIFQMDEIYFDLVRQADEYEIERKKILKKYLNDKDFFSLIKYMTIHMPWEPQH